MVSEGGTILIERLDGDAERSHEGGSGGMGVHDTRHIGARPIDLGMNRPFPHFAARRRRAIYALP